MGRLTQDRYLRNGSSCSITPQILLTFWRNQSQKHVFFCPLTILLTLSVLLYHLRSQGVSRDLQGANPPPPGGVKADRVILRARIGITIPASLRTVRGGGWRGVDKRAQVFFQGLLPVLFHYIFPHPGRHSVVTLALAPSTHPGQGVSAS